MSEMAAELSRRVSPSYVRGKAVEKASQWSQSPTTWAIAGGALGAYGGMLAARRMKRRELRMRHIDTRSEVAGRLEETKERVEGRVGQAKERVEGRVEQAKEKAGDLASQVRSKIPSTEEVKSRTLRTFESALDSQPILVLLGAVVLGGLASLLIPVSNVERRAIEPMKERAREQVETATEKIEEKIQPPSSQPPPEIPSVH